MRFKQKSLHHAPECRQTCQNYYQQNMSKIAKLCQSLQKKKVYATCVLHVKTSSLSGWSLMRALCGLNGYRGGLLKQQLKRPKLFLRSNRLPQVLTCAITSGKRQFRCKLDVVDDETESCFGQYCTQYEKSTQNSNVLGFE